MHQRLGTEQTVLALLQATSTDLATASVIRLPLSAVVSVLVLRLGLFPAPLVPALPLTPTFLERVDATLRPQEAPVLAQHQPLPTAPGIASVLHLDLLTERECVHVLPHSL
jgi:hypothetical protein